MSGNVFIGHRDYSIPVFGACNSVYHRAHGFSPTVPPPKIIPPIIGTRLVLNSILLVFLDKISMNY